MGYSPWVHKELDTTERLTLSLSQEAYSHECIDILSHFLRALPENQSGSRSRAKRC